MKNVLRLILGMALLSAAGLAQQTPVVELFGGYSYFGLPAAEGSGLTSANLNGWNASARLNLRPRIGLVADFGGNYGERRMVPTQFQPVETRPGNYRQLTVMYGPEVRVFATDRVTVNVRALIGATYVDTLVLPLPAPIQQPPDPLGNPQPPITAFRSGDEKPLTAALGGSVDYRISDRLYYRIQPELVVVDLGGVVNRMSLRLSTGIVFRLGRF